MTLTQTVTKKIISKLIKGQDYRIEIVSLINAEFLQYAIDFFKKVVEAKLRSQDITVDWYKQEFLNPNLSAQEIAINSGLNKKTIHNMYNSSKKEIVLDASQKNYEALFHAIKDLVKEEKDLELTLTVKFKGVSVDLNISESLIVINTLAVKRAELRGGLWSTAGKRVEKPLMLALCKLFAVCESNYVSKYKGQSNKTSDFEREVDFFLIDNNKKHYKCEVTLMGRGNPESADAVIARDSKVFIADKLSDTNKRQLDNLGVKWVELRSKEGYKKFAEILEHFGIAHTRHINLDRDLQKVFSELFTA